VVPFWELPFPFVRQQAYALPPKVTGLSKSSTSNQVKRANRHTMKIIAIDHVAVQTSDLDAALDFYLRILGADMIMRGKFKRREMAWLRVGVVKIELFSKREGESLQQWNDFASGPAHMAFLVPNLDAFLSEALAKGARFHPSHPAPFVPPVEGASKIAYLLGPDGEEVELRDSNDVM
jgi:catechol 2,3-dioxygenase-like lactoylglutathione lyase family enzyme